MVLDPFAPQRGRRQAARMSVLRSLELPCADESLRVLLEIGALGVDLARFAQRWNLLPEALDALVAATPMRRVEANGFSEAGWAALRQRVLDVLALEHTRAPDMIGVGRERLRRLVDPALGAAVLTAVASELQAEGAIRQTGSWLHYPEHQVRLSAAEQRSWEAVQPLLERSPFHPPRVRDLAHALQVEEGAMRQLLKRVSRLGEVYPVAHDHYFARRAVTQLARIVGDLNAMHGAARAAEFRDRALVGRKLAIQILEFFDRIGYTRRVGDTHVLRQADIFAQEQMAGVT
jgi:selenocysteine-specific elongation factor